MAKAKNNHISPPEWLLLSEALKRKADELRSSELAKRWLIMELDAKLIRFRFRTHDLVQHSGEDLSGLHWQAATVDWKQSSAVQAIPPGKMLWYGEQSSAVPTMPRELYAIEVLWTEPAAVSPPAAETQSAKTLIKAEVARVVAAGEQWESITALSKRINKRLKTEGVHRKQRTIENYLRKLALWPLPNKK